MSHETEFRFLQTVLQKLHLSLTCLTPGSVPDTPLDMGLRRFLGQEEAYDQLFGKLPFQIEDNTVCKITDNFLCRYLFLRLPGKERRVVLIGPYMTTQLSREQMLETVWKYDYTGDARTVDVHIRRLREKIERNTSQPEFIFTKWGVGYYFTDKD